MTLRDTQEAHGVVLTAGAVMICAGLIIATFPNGNWFGFGLATVGAGTTLAAIVLAWKDWRRPASARDSKSPSDPDRFWDAGKRLDALIVTSATITIATAISSILTPDDPRWATVGITAVLLVLATTARLILKSRRR